MCGIVAIFGYADQAPQINRDELRTIRDYMINRGPDGKGEWFSENGRVGLGHRRLAIIDLSERGNQPMKTMDNSLVVSFNGEIYNYRELRSQLEARGYAFQSNSDTEILLHLYREKGSAMVRELRGMFAFALWDERKKGLLLARDPYGIKPLYYADDGQTIRVASQVKALKAGGKIPDQMDPKGVSGFFLWGHVPEPYSLYKAIKSLPAGSALWVDSDGTGNPDKYFCLSKIYANATAKAKNTAPSEAHQVIKDGLLDSIRAHFTADVPVGIFLSSGLDSNTLTALAADAGYKNIQTITLGFKEFLNTPNDETQLASLTAQRYGARHVTKIISRSDFEDEMESIFNSMDQPSIDGVNTYFISKAAKELGLKVVLSGIGADELFGGYPTFTCVPPTYQWGKYLSKIPLLAEFLTILHKTLLQPFGAHPKGHGFFKLAGTFAGAYFIYRGLYLPDEIAGACPQEFLKGCLDTQSLMRMIKDEIIPDPGTDGFRISTLESSLYLRNQLLRDTDWAGMAHSIEIRTPYVDSFLVQKIANFLPTQGFPQKRTILKSLPAEPLSEEILTRKKTGFSFPLETWISHKSKPFSRVWAGRIFKQFYTSKKRILALVTDAFGGIGGIAKFNRDFLKACCSWDQTQEVVTIPRLAPLSSEEVPAKLRWLNHAINSKIKYLVTVLSLLIFKREKFDLIVCAHLNFASFVWTISRAFQIPYTIIMHGIEAWEPNKNIGHRRALADAEAFISVSRFTQSKFLNWANLPNSKWFILPNCVNLAEFTPGPPNTVLLERYGIKDKQVLMTVGRMSSLERFKGFDEILEVLPDILKTFPDLVYMLIGDGMDRPRLEQKAIRLGISKNVIFTGYVPEAAKPDYYRLANVYVMPSRGEGFGIVLLEALATGIPVIGSLADATFEALQQGTLGHVCNPADRESIKRTILEVLTRPSSPEREKMDFFSESNFITRTHSILNRLT